MRSSVIAPFALIDRLVQAQRWDAAVAALDALPEPLPTDGAALRRRRMALAIGGRVAEALETAERVAALPGSDAADLQHLAHIRLRAGRPEAAFEAAERAIRQDPSLVRAFAVAIAATVLAPALLPRLRDLLGPAPDQDPTALPTAGHIRVAIPWRLPFYRPYSGPHPVITSALGQGSRVGARWADLAAALEPARALALLPDLIAWAERVEPARRAALADFLVHRLPGAFFAVPAADLTFHHTVPFALDGRPWIFHLEHPNMVAAPMATYPTVTLRTGDAQTVLLRERLGDPSCLGVFTHIRETRRRLGRLLDDSAVATKTAYIRLGIDLESFRLSGRPKAPAVRRAVTTLLFTNSLARDNFHARGGPDVLAAFLHLAGRHDGLRLLMRSDLPAAGAEGLIGRSRRHPAVTWIRERLSDGEIDALYREADLFLLPSGLLHAVSIVRALRGGLALVASDVYGVDEFIRHRVNGWVVPGRRASVTPRGVEDAVYAEDCRSLLDPTAEPADPAFQRRFRAAIARLLDDPRLTGTIRRNARQGAARDHQGRRWAAEVSDFMERALGSRTEPSR
ncbi:glycosyltransferase [Azospirillum agricola]|uniref:glycosyltransferase n=1 Tax=Azospirillum agricola TaxID=1720247 RepID=UPI000A1C90D9|nr:glycosyltransferase [Azospirillum agricola]